MNITVWSYVEQLNISVLTDDGTLDDPHEATAATTDAFAEIRAAAGLSGRLTAVPTAMAPADPAEGAFRVSRYAHAALRVEPFQSHFWADR